MQMYDIIENKLSDSEFFQQLIQKDDTHPKGEKKNLAQVPQKDAKESDLFLKPDQIKCYWNRYSDVKT